MTAVERLLSALDAADCAPRRSGEGWAARCPAHDDRHPSMSIAQGREGAVLTCWAGCSAEEIAGALGLAVADLFDEPEKLERPRAEERKGGRPRKTPENVAPPVSEKGRTRDKVGKATGLSVAEAEVAEWHHALLTRPAVLDRLLGLRGWTRAAVERLQLGLDGDRVTLPVRDGDGALCGLLRYAPNPDARDGRKLLAAKGSRRELFPAPESLTADTLAIVEGEGDVVTGWSLGLPAVAVPGTASWRPEWGHRFAGRHVVVIPDCDDPGRRLAESVARDCAPHAASVRVLDLGPLNEGVEGFDLSDALREARDCHDGNLEAAASELRAIVGRAAAHTTSTTEAT